MKVELRVIQEEETFFGSVIWNRDWNMRKKYIQNYEVKELGWPKKNVLFLWLDGIYEC